MKTSDQGKYKSAVFKWLRGYDRLQPQYHHLVRADGTFSGCNEEIHQILEATWHPIFNRHKGNQHKMAEQFVKEYEREINILSEPMKCEALSAQRIFHKVQRTRVGTSSGLDGWRVQELQLLPPIF